MAIYDQLILDNAALYCGDSCEVLPTLPDLSVGLSIHSPPFAGLFHYSSSPRDLSNARSYEEFMAHYEFIARELARLTMPGRMAAVHCMDVPKDGANLCGSIDFPGDIIRLYERCGFEYTPRICIWKEPLAVRNRTMARSLAHFQIVEDSTLTTVACADYLIPFRKKGKNPVPVAHPHGLFSYAGGRQMPGDLLKYRGWKGKQTENRYSHWIWRNYASCFWDDIRLDRVLPYEGARDAEDEKHIHPLQLDVIERACILWSNPGEVVLTPFMGVGSEVYGALINGRRGIGVELKPTYYRQAVKNCKEAEPHTPESADGQREFTFAEEVAPEPAAPVNAASPEAPKKRRKKATRPAAPDQPCEDACTPDEKAFADAPPPALPPDDFVCPHCKGTVTQGSGQLFGRWWCPSCRKGEAALAVVIGPAAGERTIELPQEVPAS